MEKKFELTAEEVEVVRYALEYIQSNSIYYNPLLNEVVVKNNPYNLILTRIKQWKDERDNK